MKKSFSIEFKIILAVTVVLLAIVTAVVVRQVFKSNEDDVKFIYNSESMNYMPQVNISDIFVGEMNNEII